MIELNRLVAAYVAQVNEYARQHGNRLPANLPVRIPAVAIEKTAFHIAANATRQTIQKSAKGLIESKTPVAA